MPTRGTVRRYALATAIALAVLAAAPAHSGVRALASPAASQAVAVRVTQDIPSVAPKGTLAATVLVSLAAPADYVEVRFRLRSPSGRLLYQKTELRPDSPAGQLSVPFTRALGDLDVRQGRYPIEVRVLATGAQPTDWKSRALVVEPGATPVPVALVARLTATPSLDTDGVFVLDPEAEPGVLKDAARIADLAKRRERASFSIAIAPLLLEEWSRAADGYEVVGPHGVREVSAAGVAALEAADALARLRAVAEGGSAEFVDVPYAEPDLVNMRAAGLLGDLDLHWAAGDAVRATTLGSVTTASAAVLGDVFPADTLPLLANRGLGSVVLSSVSVDADETTAAPGVYELSGGLRGLVVEPRLAESLASDESEAFYDALFERLTSDRPEEALCFVVDIGPGTRYAARDVEQALTWLDAIPWARPVPVREAAQSPASGTASLVESPERAPAAASYWDEVALGRLNAVALASALGPDDPDALAARSNVLVAESRMWSGPGGDYADADRGLEFAARTVELTRSLLSSVKVDGRDVTLANRRGDVPIAVTNGSSKPLTVRVVTTAARVGIPRKNFAVTLDPGDNVVSVPVDMAFEISDKLHVRVRAGDLTLGETSFTVRASYLDRLASVGMVTVFLIGMLVFIRRRVRAAIADNISSDAESPDA